MHVSRSPSRPSRGPLSRNVFVRRAALSGATTAAAGSLAGWWIPRGPVTTVDAVVALLVALGVGFGAGVLVGFVEDGHVTLAADAGPSMVLLLASVALVGRWLRALSPHESTYVRPTLWVS